MSNSIIIKHDFNSLWSNQNVGFVSDHEGFEKLSNNALIEQLNEFDWVEFSSDEIHRFGSKLKNLGFQPIDCQIPFKLKLSNLNPPRLADIEVKYSSETNFEDILGKSRLFASERYFALKNFSAEKINERYLNWAYDLSKSNPKHCLVTFYNGTPQGWYCATPNTNTELELTLACLQNESKISGRDHYHACLAFYQTQGFTDAAARISATNAAVFNIIAGFGAKFSNGIFYWLWEKNGSFKE